MRGRRPLWVALAQAFWQVAGSESVLGWPGGRIGRGVPFGAPLRAGRARGRRGAGFEPVAFEEALVGAPSGSGDLWGRAGGGDLGK